LLVSCLAAWVAWVGASLRLRGRDALVTDRGDPGSGCALAPDHRLVQVTQCALASGVPDPPPTAVVIEGSKSNRRRLAATRYKDLRVSSTAGSLPPTVAATRLRFLSGRLI